ncbi:MAG TPA: LamG-like jellyroll fold domain-containing protein, partial [bacterium]|nr:LamG-like jellyroll fold domain-containing protein [bacterium]
MPSGLTLWLRADAGVVADEQGHVSLWRDQSGNGHDAAAVGAPPQWQSPGMGQCAAVAFNGQNMLIAAGNGSLITDTFNYTVWFKARVESAGPTQGEILSNYNGGGFYFGYNNRQWQDTDCWTVSGAPVPMDQSVETLFRVTPNGMEIFSNGVRVDQRSPSCDLSADLGSPWYLGTLNAGGVLPFLGTITEMKVFNRALSNAELQALPGCEACMATLSPEPTPTATAGPCGSCGAQYCENWDELTTSMPPNDWGVWDEGQGAEAWVDASSAQPGQSLYVDCLGQPVTLQKLDVDASQADLSVQVDSADQAGLVVDGQGSNGSWTGGYYLQAGGGQVSMGLTNSAAPLSSLAMALHTPYVLELQAQNGTLTGLVNGVVVLGPVTDNTYSHGAIGLQVYGANPVELDNFKLNPLPQCQATATSTATSTWTLSATPSPTQTATQTASPSPSPAVTGCVMPSGLSLWLRADQGVTQNGLGITAWADQSGHGHHAITVGGAPQWLSDGPGNCPAVSFNGSSTKMAISAGDGLVVTDSLNYTVWMKGSVDGTGPVYQTIFSNWVGGPNDLYFGLQNGPWAFS